MVRLVRNYRSSPQVVALANRVFGQADRLIAQREPGDAPKLTEYSDEPAEAADVARRAAALIVAGRQGEAREESCSVRTNAMTVRFEEALAEAGVPFQLRGAERLLRPAQRSSRRSA